MTSPYSRILIAGTGGDSGKTIVSLGLLASWNDAELVVRAFKKGPDFIDAAWLGWAARSPGRNLDTYMMGSEVVRRSFLEHGVSDGLNLIEGNRGLLDGVDATGSHSSAGLARLLECPVVLVLSPVKVTATAAATVLGCRQLAPEVEIAGVILNRIRGERHERVVRQAIEEHAGVPVLGALPNLTGPTLVSRHLGLVPPAEHGPAAQLRATLVQNLQQYVDLDRLLTIARSARPLVAASEQPSADAAETGRIPGEKVRIGFFSDTAFTFYYPENLEALERGGATLTAISALAHEKLPTIDALYIGGGFPETHTRELAANTALLAAVRRAAGDGLPIYAECGGLMYLAESLEWRGETIPLSGVLPIQVRMHGRPQGHGYCRMTVDTANPFLPVGLELRGHEFHYSSVQSVQSVQSLKGETAGVKTAFAVSKGQGCFDQRDGIVQGNVLASYLHLHALGSPEWARGLIAAAVAYHDGVRGDGPPPSSAAEKV
ncbi:MAG: cobyrinate a,c-diamide synthase [bacterium]